MFSSCAPSYSRIFSIADFATAFVLAALGCLAFSDLPLGPELQFSRIILAVYLVLAGAVLSLCAIFDITPVRKNLPAFYSYVGKATAGLLLGTLALGTSKNSVPLSISVICWSISCFFLSMFMTTPPMPLFSCGGSSSSEFPATNRTQTASPVIVKKEAPRAWRLEGSQPQQSQPKPNPFGSSMRDNNAPGGGSPNPFNSSQVDAAYTPPQPFRSEIT
jgi:hypothetical protein